MTTFSANIGELEQTSNDLRGASEELHELFEEYAAAFLANAGIAYEEGTEVYNALHDGVEQAVKNAEQNVAMLEEHSAKAATVASNVEETESQSVSRIRSNIG